MKRRIIIALVTAALTAMLVPTAVGQPRATVLRKAKAGALARSRATSGPRGQAFYVSTRYGKLDPWVVNLIARNGYRVVSSS